MVRIVSRQRLLQLVAACTIPFAGLAMAVRTPSEFFALDVKMSPMHDVSLEGSFAFGPAEFTMSCKGSGEFGQFTQRKDQITCILTGSANQDRFDMTMDMRIVEDMTYVRLHSFHTESKSLMTNSEVNRYIGRWITFPTYASQQKNTSAVSPAMTAENLRMTDRLFSIQQTDFAGGHRYLLRLRKGAWQPILQDVLAKQHNGFSLDPKTIDVQMDMKFDVDNQNRLQMMNFVINGEATAVLTVKGKLQFLPMHFSLSGKVRARSTQPNIVKPANAIPAAGTSFTVNSKSGANQQIVPLSPGMPLLPPSLQTAGLSQRGVRSVGEGLYLVTTPTQVILFDATTGKIVRAGQK